jgi:hypothetical protein
MLREIIAARIPVEKRQFILLLGILGLAIGSFIYLVDRHPDGVYFIYNTSKELSLFHRLPNFFGSLGYWLPAFIHPFSFSLLTASISTPSKKKYTVICLFWCGVNIIFEMGQKFKLVAVAFIPDWFAGIPYLENCKSYFINGTFDYLDIASVILGAIAAFAILFITSNRGLAQLCECEKES